MKGALGGLMEQAQKMQDDMKLAQAELANAEVQVRPVAVWCQW